jgi:hypothetical protein
LNKCFIHVHVNNILVSVINNWPSLATILFFTKSLHNLIFKWSILSWMMYKILLWLNGFHFPIVVKSFVWLLMLVMHFKFHFMCLGTSIVFSNFGYQVLQRLVYSAFHKGWIFFLHYTLKWYFLLNWLIVDWGISSIFKSLLICNHTNTIMKNCEN